MTQKFIKVFLFVGLLFSHSAFAAGPYYFNYTAGNNANACTIGSPCKDFDGKGLDNLNALAADEFVYFKCGEIWPEGSSEVAVNSNGTSGHPITLDRYGTCSGSNDPILRGSTAQATWTLRTYSVTADSSTDTFTRTSHGLLNGSTIYFTADSLPSGISAGIKYYVVQKQTDTFKVSTSSGGSAVSLSTNGTNVIFNNATYQKTFGAYQGIYIVGIDNSYALQYWTNTLASMQTGTFQPDFATPTTLRIRLEDDSNPSGHTIYVPSTRPDGGTGNRGLLRGGKENDRGKFVDIKNIKVQWSNGNGATASGQDNHWENVTVQGAAEDGIKVYKNIGSPEDGHGFRCHNCKWSYGAMMGATHGQGFTTYSYDVWIYGDPPVNGVYTCSGTHNNMAGADFLAFNSGTDVHNSGIVYCDMTSNGEWKSEPSYDPNIYFDGANNVLAYGNKISARNGQNPTTGSASGSEHPDTASLRAHHIYIINNLIYGNHWAGVGTGNSGNTKNISDVYWINNTISAYDAGGFEMTIDLNGHASTANTYHWKNNIFIVDDTLPTYAYHPGEPVGSGLDYIDSDYNIYHRRGGYSVIHSTNGGNCKTSTPSSTCWDLARWRTNLGGTGSGDESHSLFGNPLVTLDSDTAFDAHLQAGSPAINAGLSNPYPLPTWVPLDILPDGGAVVGSTIASGAADTGNTDMGYHYAIDTGAVTIGALTSTNFQPATLIVNAVGTATVSFTTATTWPNNGTMTIALPTTLGGGYTANSGGTTVAGSLTGIDGSLAVAIASNVITLTRSGGTATSPSAISFTLSHIKNPPTDGSTDVYQFKTKTSTGTVIDQDLNVAADTISSPGTGTYYVSTTGNDSNPGTSGSPFLTIQKCVSTAINPGNTCIVTNGTYTAGFQDNLALGGSGTEMAPITIKAQNRGGVTIDQSTLVTGWTSISTNKYISSAVGGAVNGNRLWKVGRTTVLTIKSSSSNVISENDYYYEPTTDKFVIYTTSNPALSVYKQVNKSNAILVRGVSWVVVDGFNIQYSSTPIGVGYSSGFPTPPSQSALGPTSHITIQYCTISYSYQWGVYSQSSITNLTSYILFDNNTIQYVSEAVGGQNGHCYKSAANNLNDGGTYVTVSNSTIHDCHYHGIQHSVGWSHGYYFNNRIYNTSLKGSGAGADIRCGYSGSSAPSDCNIHDNDLGGGPGGIGNGPGSGIYLQDTNVGSNIYNNAIHNHVWHGIYSFYAGTGPTCSDNATIYNNIIYDNDHTGIKDDCSKTIHILNNTFSLNGDTVGSSTASIYISNNTSVGVDVRNNIIYNNTAFSMYTKVNYSLYPSDNNVFYRTAGFAVTWTGTPYTGPSGLANYNAATTGITPLGLDHYSLTTDPDFIGPTNSDFHIPLGASSAYHTGANLSTFFSKDYDDLVRAVPWDIGAYVAKQIGTITSASVVPDSLDASASGNTTVAFTLPDNDLASTSKIVIAFPTGFTLNSGGVTDITSVSGFDGTSTVSVSGRIVTITRNGDGNTSPQGTVYSFSLTKVRNPFIPGTTQKYNIKMKDQKDTLFAVNSNIAGNEIIGATIPTATFGGVVLAGLKTN